MSRISAFPVVGALLLAGILSGCSPQTTAETTAAISNDSISEEQAAALADDNVTYDEYQAALRRYVACDEKAGYAVQLLGETNQVTSFQVPNAAVESGADEKCYGVEFRQIDMIWQVSRQDTSPQAVKIHDCLLGQGVTPDPDYDVMIQQLRDLGVSAETCTP